MGATDAIRVSSFVLTWPRILGISLAEVASASGIPLERLEGARELSYDETLALWRALEVLTGDPVVGLHAGAKFTIDQMGVVGPALAHATHVDAAIDVLVRIMGVFARNAGISRTETEGGAGLAYRMPTLRARHGVDTVFAATVALLRDCTEPAPATRARRGQLVPLTVEHQMPRLSEAEYAAFYGVVPRWDRPECKLVFSKADLARPFRGASPELAKLLSDNVGRLLAPEATRASFEDELERAFWTAHQRGEATLETTAEVLGLTARTLQRRLGAKGTSFADERGKLLVRRATELLRDESLPVESVAERLGYTSRAAFERAFQRWTGKTPSAARRT